MREGILRNFIEPNVVQIEINDGRELVSVSCDEVGAAEVKEALLQEDAILVAYDEVEMKLASPF